MIFTPPELNDRCNPSGDQREAQDRLPPSGVNWTALEPSRSHSHIATFPERFDSKEIRLPSGAYWPLNSKRVDEMSGAFSHFGSLPSESLARMRQIFGSSTLRVKHRRPRGETARSSSWSSSDAT